MGKQISISIRSLSGGYKNKPVLKDFSADFLKGSFTAIAGPNGTGKSTLMKYLIRELKTKDNTIFVNNSDINSLSQKKLAKNISFVNQNHKDNPDFTVYELVELGRYCYEKDHECSLKCQNALKAVGIENLKNCLLSELSGGELQLAMLARAICQDTDIILLDEPVNSLDPMHQIILLRLLRKLADSGKTIICTLHDLNAVLSWCDTCILIKEGCVFACGNTKEVLTKSNIKELYNTDCEIINQADGRLLLTFCCNP